MHDSRWKLRTCVQQVAQLSFLVDIEGHLYRRNRKFLSATAEPKETEKAEQHISVNEKLPEMPQMMNETQQSETNQSETSENAGTPHKSEIISVPQPGSPMNLRPRRNIKTPARFQDCVR